jgi:VanZ family protein
MALIFAASSLPDLQAPGVSDKTAHLFAYALLGAGILRALALAEWSGVTGARVAYAVLVSVAYGITDELHQWFVPNRTPDIGDVVADLTGAAVAAGVCWAWSIIRRFRGSPAR